MMRRPTSLKEQLAWHTAVMAGEPLDIYGEYPEVGWFRRRLVKGGMFVPARIWLLQDIDHDTGELANDEVFLCEINGQPEDVFDAWPWLCGEPITEVEFNHLNKVQEWAAWHAPHAPEANPRQPVDMNTVDLPFI